MSALPLTILIPEQSIALPDDLLNAEALPPAPEGLTLHAEIDNDDLILQAWRNDGRGLAHAQLVGKASMFRGEVFTEPGDPEAEVFEDETDDGDSAIRDFLEAALSSLDLGVYALTTCLLNGDVLGRVAEHVVERSRQPKS